jgi:hypothetical protein
MKFNEIIGIDATYDTNIFGMALVIFVCVDNFGLNFPLAGCFIRTEKYESYLECLTIYDKIFFQS